MTLLNFGRATRIRTRTLVLNMDVVPSAFGAKSFTATRYRLTAQGCRFGYPGFTGLPKFNRDAVASTVATLSGLLTMTFANVPQG